MGKTYDEKEETLLDLLNPGVIEQHDIHTILAVLERAAPFIDFRAP